MKMGNISYGISRILKKMLQPKTVKNCKIDKTAKIGAGTQFVNSSIGRYSYTGENCACVGTEIGAFCSIAANVSIGGGSHPMDWVSTSPVFHSGRNALHIHFASHEFSPYTNTHIGNDVWIGSRCLIKGGVTIGDGAIIGMGSVVTKDVPPYTIVGGNPAKLIRMRFSESIIDRLLSSKWWGLNDALLFKYAEKANSPEAFLTLLEEYSEETEL